MAAATTAPDRGGLARRITTVSCSTLGVGKVTKLIRSRVKVNKQPVVGTQPLNKRARIATSKRGRVAFCLNTKGSHCRTLRRSLLQVAPGDGYALAVRRGFVTCNTTTKKHRIVRVKTVTGARVMFKDPVYALDVRPNATIVQVVKGLVYVSSASGGSPIVVGPGQQVAVPAGGQPSQPEKLDQTPAEAADAGVLAQQVPAPNYSRPPSGDSPTLSRIYKTGTIDLGIDLSDPNDAWRSAELKFVATYCAFLAKQWKLKLNLLQFTKSPDEVGNALAGGEIEVGVTPNLVDQVPVFALPFFFNPDRSDWDFVGDESDEGLLTALDGFVNQTVLAGLYGNLYLHAFKQAPDYGIFGG
jgi:hypothetical protein